MDLRNKHVTYKTNGIINPIINTWEIETPKEIRATSVKDVVNAYKTSFGNLKNGNIDKFDISFKSKRKKNDSIGIQNSSANIKDGVLKIYPLTLGKDGVRLGKRNKKKFKNLKIDHDCRLQFDGCYYYLCIPVPAKKFEKDDGNNILSLDPGVRTFMTGYDPSGKIIEYNLQKDKISRITNTIDFLNKKKSNKLKRRKKTRKLINIIDDLHWRTINDLTQNYNIILLPEFESQEMVKRSSNKKMNRGMNILSHFKFKTRLKYKINCFKNTKLYNVTEEYTSKTCTKCGNIKNDLGSSKVYNCVECLLKIDRDINGARNILIKNLHAIGV
jgi:putative transposase